MTIVGRVLAEGQLPTTQAALYTATAVVYVTFINLVNTNSTAQTVELWLNASGTPRRLLYVTGLEQYERVEVSERIVLESGDVIEGRTTTANAVDYIITGGLTT